MQDYLDTKPDDFDDISAKRFLLGQAREQVSWYRQAINAIDYVGAVVYRRALETGMTRQQGGCQDRIRCLDF